MAEEPLNVRENWRRTEHRNLSDHRTQTAVERFGKAIIGRWEHKDGTGVVRYWYEPDRELPYRVEIRGTQHPDRRFKTRSDGGSYNKELLRDPEINRELAVYCCEAETADGTTCEIQVENPSDRCHLHSQDGESQGETA